MTEMYELEKCEEDNEDIQYVNLSVKIYKADGIPRPDSGIMTQVKKIFSVEAAELLDPYIRVSLGDLKGSTSKKKKTMTPCWNEQIVFTLKFPLPAQLLIIQLRDDEITRDDVVGIVCIDLERISYSDNTGFLPTFGPCYVYFRESRGISSRESDVAFRGRLLMALSTDIISNQTLCKPYVFTEPIAPLYESPCGQEVDFLLFACIRDVTMIEKKFAEKPLSFSLQIEKFEDSTFPYKMYITVMTPRNFAGAAVTAKWTKEDTRNITGHVPEHETNNKTCGGIFDEAQKSNRINGLNDWETNKPMYCSSVMTPVTTNRKLCYVPIHEKKECLWLESSWPDYRRPLYISNILEKIIQEIELCLDSLQECKEMKIKEENLNTVMKDLENSIFYYLKVLKQNWRMFLSTTQLDKERWKIYEKHLKSVHEFASSHQKEEDGNTIDLILAKLEKMLKEIKGVKDDPQPALPDVVVWMESNQKRIGYYQIAARDVLYSINNAEKGLHCGKVRSIFFKPLSKKKSSLYLAKLEVYLWLGLKKHFKQCLQGLPGGFDTETNGKEIEQIDYLPRKIYYYEKQIYQLHAHIYQARFLPWVDKSKPPSPVALLYIGDKCLSTQIEENTLSPIWDETLIFSNLIFYGNEINLYSPDLVIEIFNYNPAGRSTCICRGVIPIPGIESNNVPAMKWHDVNSFDVEETAQVLAAFELIFRSCGDDETDAAESKFHDIGPVMQIPLHIRPRSSVHRLEVLFWGLRELKRVKLIQIEAPRIEVECGGKIIQSNVITNYRKHSNFRKMIELIDMELPENEACFPALTIQLLDCKSFGRRHVLASHVVNRLQKYVVKLQGKIMEPKFEKHFSEQGDVNDSKDTVVNIQYSEQQPSINPYIFFKVLIPWVNSWKFNEEDSEEERDWWSRYYISSIDSSQAKKLSIHRSIVPKTGRRSLSGCPLLTTLNFEQQSQSKLFKDPQFLRMPDELNFRMPKILNSNLDAQSFEIYSCELENVPDFGGFKEWLHSFKLTTGRTFAKFYGDAEKTVAIFKGCFRIYELPLHPYVVDPLLPISDNPVCLFNGLPENKPIAVFVRVYIVEAIDLAPSDVTNTADAYIVIRFGNQMFSDKENYVSKQLNPVFGKCFEFLINFPTETMLHIQVMDWDLMKKDDLIGDTKIDLENRFYSRHRATCGLARTYETSGPNCWRDVYTPIEILTDLCLANGLGTPQINEKDVRIANIVYDFSSNPQGDKESKQNMALYLLHQWKDIVPGKYSLVPEHLETRTLYHPSKPGESRGKLVMWVDMFPENSAPQPSRNISKRKPVGYELRVIIWNTDEVILADNAFFTGEKMSDIYVKGWLTGKEDTQRTDVHYRSLTGEGNFNWRFLFPFDYLPIERKIVVMKKATVLSWDETEYKLNPELKLQVFDADHFKSDDYLGEITLDLRKFPRGAKSAAHCSLEILRDDETIPQISIFKQRRIKGWWPVSVETQDVGRKLTGKIEAELHLLTREEAEKFPVGLGRKEPNPLPEPKRPETSFVNFIHPLKTFRYAIWKNYKKSIIKVTVFIASILLFLLFIYSAPGYAAKRLIGA